MGLADFRLVRQPSGTVFPHHSEGRMTRSSGLGPRSLPAGALFLLSLIPAAVGAAQTPDSVRGRGVSASDASPGPAARVLVAGTPPRPPTPRKGEDPPHWR